MFTGIVEAVGKVERLARRPGSLRLAIRAPDVDLIGKPEHFPDQADPGANGHDDLFDLDGALAGFDGCDGSCGVLTEPFNFDPR